MRALTTLRDLAPHPIWDGARARILSGQDMDLAVVELAPGAVVAEHEHGNEQMGLVIEGSVTFRVGDEEQLLNAGGMWRIPPHVPHEVRAGRDGAVVLDIFAPPRLDWAGIVPERVQAPRWPRER